MFPNSVGRMILDGTENVRDHRELGGLAGRRLTMPPMPGMTASLGSVSMPGRTDAPWLALPAPILSLHR